MKLSLFVLAAVFVAVSCDRVIVVREPSRLRDLGIDDTLGDRDRDRDSRPDSNRRSNRNRDTGRVRADERSDRDSDPIPTRKPSSAPRRESDSNRRNNRNRDRDPDRDTEPDTRRNRDRDRPSGSNSRRNRDGEREPDSDRTRNRNRDLGRVRPDDRDDPDSTPKPRRDRERPSGSNSRRGRNRDIDPESDSENDRDQDRPTTGSRRQSNRSCGVSKKDAINAMQELFLVGEKNFFVPENHCDIIEHCDNIQDKTKLVLGHLKCLEHGSARLVFTSLARGYLRENPKRCANKEWREQFLDFGDCLRKSDAAADVHQCGYKLHDAYQYALDNFELDHQLQFSCCAMKLMDSCIHKQMVKDCRDDIAEFSPELFWTPLRETYTIRCPGIESLDQCRKMYPTEMKYVEKIFKSTKKLSPRNFMVPGYELHANRGSKVPKFVDVAK